MVLKILDSDWTLELQPDNLFTDYKRHFQSRDGAMVSLVLVTCSLSVQAKSDSSRSRHSRDTIKAQQLTSGLIQFTSGLFFLARKSHFKFGAQLIPEVIWEK